VILSSTALDDDTWRVTARTTNAGGDNSYAIQATAVCATAS